MESDSQNTSLNQQLIGDTVEQTTFEDYKSLLYVGAAVLVIGCATVFATQIWKKS